MSGVQRRSSLAQAEVEGDRDLDPGSEIVSCASGDEHVPFL